VHAPGSRRAGSVRRCSREGHPPHGQAMLCPQRLRLVRGRHALPYRAAGLLDHPGRTSSTTGPVVFERALSKPLRFVSSAAHRHNVHARLQQSRTSVAGYRRFTRLSRFLCNDADGHDEWRQVLAAPHFRCRQSALGLCQSTGRVVYTCPASRDSCIAGCFGCSTSGWCVVPFT